MSGSKYTLSQKQSIETAIVFAIAGIVIFLKWHLQPALWVACILLALALLIPSAIYPLAWLWFGLSKILSWISSRIILTVLFYLMVTPVGVIRRLTGKDSLQLNAFKKNKKSTYVERNHLFTETDLKYPF